MLWIQMPKSSKKQQNITKLNLAIYKLGYTQASEIIQGMQGWFKMQISINVIHSTDWMKDQKKKKNHMISLLDKVKALDKILTFYDKNT